MKTSQIAIGMTFLFLFTASTRVLAATATADLHGTAAQSSLSGQVTFEETPDGLKIHAEVRNAPPGKHGFHIHEVGDCGDSGNKAGGHFNPDGVAHGLVTQDGLTGAHPGDLGNFEIGPDGTGNLEVIVPGLTLGEGKYSVAGRAVILHEKEDDFGQPTGNAGARIGCGLIERL